MTEEKIDELLQKVYRVCARIERHLREGEGQLPKPTVELVEELHDEVSELMDRREIQSN